MLSVVNDPHSPIFTENSLALDSREAEMFRFGKVNVMSLLLLDDVWAEPPNFSHQLETGWPFVLLSLGWCDFQDACLLNFEHLPNPLLKS